jgi:hypothetical protein
MSAALKQRPGYDRRKYGLYGPSHPRWKEKIPYSDLHAWVRRERGAPRHCEHCGTTKAQCFHWANKSHEYNRVPEDWLRLCARCHAKYDDRGRLRREHAPTGRRTSKYKGVYWDSESRNWRVEFSFRGKRYLFGSHKNEEDAAIVYNVAAQLILPEGAYLNSV